MQANARQVLDQWLEGVNAGKLDDVIRLYDPKAILLPTFSNRRLNSTESIREYFVRLASHDRLSVSLHEKTLRIQQLSETIHLVSGIYCWELDVEEENLKFEARFSYVFDLASDSPIVHHHSSQIPRML